MLEFNKKNARSWSMLGPSGAFGAAVEDIAGYDNDLAVISADLCAFSGLGRMQKKFPEKLYNIGIAEQNMIGVAAGMVREGMHVFATSYATFASARVLDQVKMVMGYMKLPVNVIGLTSGYAEGLLGATHMAIEDIALMRAIPNIIVLSPADGMEIVKCVYAAAECDKPVYIRLTGTQRMPIIYTEDYDFDIGKAVALKEGTDVSIFATGTVISRALEAAKALEADGISCAVINMHTIKPLDVDALETYSNSKLIVTVEEHSVIGGLGSAIAEKLCPKKDKPPQIMIGIEDSYPHAASYEYLMKNSGLTANNISVKIKTALAEL